MVPELPLLFPPTAGFTILQLFVGPSINIPCPELSRTFGFVMLSDEFCDDPMLIPWPLLVDEKQLSIVTKLPVPFILNPSDDALSASEFWK